MKIVIKNLQKRIPVNPKRIHRVVLNTLSLESIKKSGEITICFVGDKQIKELNLVYSGRDCATDVLSFDSSMDKKEIIGDIVVSADTACRNARIFKTAPLYELCLYAAHGVLHILGYDDRTIKQKKTMQDKAVRILSGLNQG